MPKECELLKKEPYVFEKCKLCGTPFPEFMRGQVQSSSRKFFGLPYCAVICHNCKDVIGWEQPTKRTIKLITGESVEK